MTTWPARTFRGSMGLALRALRGFPEAADGSFELADVDFAIVEITIARLPEEEDNDDANDDDNANCDTGSYRIHRSLAEFLHLERCLDDDDDGGARAQQWRPPPGAMRRAIDAALNTPGARDTLFIRRRRAERIPRLLFELERLLGDALQSSGDHPALRRFVCPDALYAIRDSTTPAASWCDPVMTHLRALLGQEPPLPAGAQVETHEVQLASGCTMAHDVDLRRQIPPLTAPAPFDEGSGDVIGTLVLWRFEVLTNNVLEFTVTHEPASDDKQLGEGEDTGDASAEPLDPYSEAAMAAAFAETVALTRPPAEILHYRTRYENRSSAGSSSTSSPREAYGVVFIRGSTTPGTIHLEWTNVDENSIFSKSLPFQVMTIPCPTSAKVVMDLVDRISQAPVPEESISSWLEHVVQEHGSQEDDDDESKDEENYDLTLGGPTESRTTATIADFHQALLSQQADSRVMALETELQRLRSDLKAAKNELEVSSEIYKANLETIARLEIAAHSSQATDTVLAQEDEEEFADEVDKDSQGLLASDEVLQDNERLRELCATFQEQCLWRSIETTESEKRNLLLEAELGKANAECRRLQEQVDAQNLEMEAFHVDMKKLKAQKSLLVQEVKRLQPYSEVNIAVLIQEAQEARMIQRSLQVRISELEGDQFVTIDPVSMSEVEQ